jgi:hypothetical protein
MCAACTSDVTQMSRALALLPPHRIEVGAGPAMLRGRRHQVG